MLTMFRRPTTGQTILYSIGLLTLLLSGCGSSDSAMESDTSLPEAQFQEPVDAETLRMALVTGSTSDDTDVFWQCAINDLNMVFLYRLFADGSGSEIDMSNPTLQSVFTWQTTSASTMTTTVVESGVQTMFSQILFSNDSNFSLIAPNGLMLNCIRQGDDAPTPEGPIANGSNSLEYGGTSYALTHGFEETFSFVQNTVRNDTHSRSEFSVADAVFRLQVIPPIGAAPAITLWRPLGGSVWFTATLFSPGAEGFESATFDFEPDDVDENGPSVAGRNFFNEGRLAVDIDGSETFDTENSEFIDVSAGSITVNRLGGNMAQMSFDVVLEDGLSVRGSFQGAFILFEN